MDLLENNEWISVIELSLFVVGLVILLVPFFGVVLFVMKSVVVTFGTCFTMVFFQMSSVFLLLMIF